MTIPGETASIIVMVTVPAVLLIIGFVVHALDQPKQTHKPKVISK